MTKVETAHRTAEQLVALNLRRIREQQGIQSAALAARVGMTPQVYSALEGGSRRIRVDELMSLALALSVAPAVLLVPWDDDGYELAVELRGGAEVHVFGTRAEGANRVRAPHDFIVGRLNPGLMMSLNPRTFTDTGPSSVVEDELNWDRYGRLSAAGWNMTLDGTSVTSPGGMTRTEAGDAPRGTKAGTGGKTKRATKTGGSRSGQKGKR
jgi:transcriptional regulator with XRE-family HTH domain